MYNRTVFSWLVTILLVMGCTIAVLWKYLSHSREELKILELKNTEITNLLASSQDTLLQYQDREGHYKSKILLLETYNVDTFLELQAKDKDIQWLQSVVEQYKKQIKNPGDAAIVIESDTKIDQKIESKTKEEEWSQRFLSKNYKDDWVDLAYYIDQDTTGFSLKVTNKYNVVLGTDDKGKRFVDITNLNPYTKTSVMRSYQLLDETPTIKKKRWGLGASVGYFLNKDGFSPAVGISINRNLLVW